MTAVEPSGSTPTPPNDGSAALLPAWVEPHTAYVARCGECRATPDQDGGEYRRSPWDAARAVNEVEGWRIENGALLCPDCACVDCPACDGSGSPLRGRFSDQLVDEITDIVLGYSGEDGVDHMAITVKLRELLAPATSPVTEADHG